MKIHYTSLHIIAMYITMYINFIVIIMYVAIHKVNDQADHVDMQMGNGLSPS